MIKCKVCNVRLTARNLIDNDFCNKEVCHLVWDYVTWFPDNRCGNFKSYPQDNENNKNKCINKI